MASATLAMTFAAACLPVSANAVAADDAEFARSVGPFLNRYCAECHGGKKPEQGLNLAVADANKPTPTLRNVDQLDKIAQRLRAQTMPPADHELLPEPQERTAVIAWLDACVDEALSGESNPGRVTIRRLTRVDYRNTVRDLLGVEVDTSAFPSDDIAHGFDNLADVISLPPLLMERYLDAAEEASRLWFDEHVVGDPALRPSDERPADEIAEELLLPLQERAYRRPTTEDERAGLMAFFAACVAEEHDFRDAIQASVQAVLMAPQFLYRMEQDGLIGQDRPLDDFELATRLSYFLWSSMPDEALFETARRGDLAKPEILESQVRRMLADGKVRGGLVENFAGQWLQIHKLQAVGPDAKAFPQFDEPLRQAMAAETYALVEDIARNDRSLFELLTADYTFVNERLARHYGIQGVGGDETQRVSLGGSPRRGILTHASVLTLTSHPRRTSPVIRGKWILEAVLGTPPPPPVADAGELEETKVSGTLRERLEQHRSDRRCASCHRQMDPLGFALENFDAVGLWRTEDQGQPIDPAGTLPDGSQFDGPQALIDVLTTARFAEQFRENAARQALVYAVGRPLERYDRPEIRRIVDALRAGDDRVSSLVLAIAGSNAFRVRRNVELIAVEKLPDTFKFELEGNPDQSMVLKVAPREEAGQEKSRAAFEVHSLKPLLGAAASNGEKIAINTREVEFSGERVYQSQVEAPLGVPLHLFFMKGMIGPQDYSDDFLMPVKPIDAVDERINIEIAHWQNAWNSDLRGPGNPRPGTVYSLSLDVNLIAKERDTINVYLQSSGHRGIFQHGGDYKLDGEGLHRITRVGRRNTSMDSGWVRDLAVIIHTRPQSVVGNLSPIRFVRPMLGVSSQKPIDLGRIARGKTKTSETREIYNAQKTVLVDHEDNPWPTVLYGTARILPAEKDKPSYMVTNDHVGAVLVGEHAKLFKLVGPNAAKDGQSLRLIGSEEEDASPGLAGGPDGGREPFQVRFSGAKKPGDYEAAVRIVTQAGNLGELSKGGAGEPLAGFHYVDIPIKATVR